jgi:dihydroflavonol-4-reductase
MKIFITGATGFIGTHLIEALNGKGHTLTCLVRKSSTTKTCKKYGCELVYGDVTDKASVLSGMRGCNWVINLANIYSLWEPDPSIYSKVNIEGTRNVMEAALETEVKKVVHISTIAIFGNSKDSPITENSLPGTIRYSRYAETKYQGEKIAWDLYEKKHLPLVVLYPVSVLGPGDTKATGQYIELLVKRKMPALAFTYSKLTFVNVKNVAEAIVKAIEKPNNIGEKYIVGKEQLTVGELSKMISDLAGVPLPKIELPGWLALLSAFFITKVADIIKKPPIWGMAIDQIKTIKEDIILEECKTEKELKIKYHSIRNTISDYIDWVKKA